MLVEDVILRQQQNPQEQLMYTVEVFTDGSNLTNTQSSTQTEVHLL